LLATLFAASAPALLVLTAASAKDYRRPRRLHLGVQRRYPGRL